jgi:RES domain-containing protein
VTIEIPGDAPLETIDAAQLPKNWSSYPAPARLAQIGTSWAKGGRTLVLVVPSAVVRGEENVLLNPAHARMADVKIVDAVPFGFDPRLLRARG